MKRYFYKGKKKFILNVPILRNEKFPTLKGGYEKVGCARDFSLSAEN